MSSATEKVLAAVDADLDQSLERLFSFLRIPSISTDSAFKADCQRAAEWLAADVESIGFDAAPRATAGHPVVVGRMNGDAKRHALFYGVFAAAAPRQDPSVKDVRAGGWPASGRPVAPGGPR